MKNVLHLTVSPNLERIYLKFTVLSFESDLTNFPVNTVNIKQILIICFCINSTL